MTIREIKPSMPDFCGRRKEAAYVIWETEHAARVSCVGCLEDVMDLVPYYRKVFVYRHTLRQQCGNTEVFDEMKTIGSKVWQAMDNKGLDSEKIAKLLGVEEIKVRAFTSGLLLTEDYDYPDFDRKLLALVDVEV